MKEPPYTGGHDDDDVFKSREDWTKLLKSLRLLQQNEVDVFISGSGNIYVDKIKIEKVDAGEDHDGVDLTAFAGLLEILEDEIKEIINSNDDNEKKKVLIRDKLKMGIERGLPTILFETEREGSE